MKTSLPLAAALIAAFTLSASAEDYDLKKLFEREFEVGSKYLESSSEDTANKQTVSQGGQVLQQQDEAGSMTQERIVEVLGAREDGKPNKVRYTYKSASVTKSGEEKVLEVEGLVVTVDMSGEAPKVEAAEGKEIPESLKARLMGEARKDMKEKSKEGPEAMLPEKPVAVGAEWTKDPKAALKSMGIPGEGLVDDKSSVNCKLEEGEGGALKVTMKLEFVFTSFQGMPCEEPMVIKLDVELNMSREGMPLGSMKNAMTMGGKLSANGAMVEMSMKQEGMSTRSAVK